MTDLSSYNNNSVLKGTQDLFNSLGIRLNTPTDTPLPLAATLSDAPKEVTKMLDKVKEAFFVGTIDNLTLQGRDEALSLDDEISGINEHYKGMMVFAVDIGDGKKVTRSEITTLNRALNRKSKAAPVALVVRYGEFISFSICERTAYLQSGLTGEKPGKVSLLRNIRYSKPHRGHVDILEGMKANGIDTFDALYDKWLKVFNNDTLTDRFYVELQNWFFWAIKVVSFPNDIEDDTDDEKYNPENIIRLITRLIFVWFLMQKGLVPRQIFKKAQLPNILKDFDPESLDSSQYYRAILQNLFFATLNKPIEKRCFAFDEGWVKNRSTKSILTLYRFEQDFVWWNPENPKASRIAVQQHVVDLFSHVPYMNNSLFECLDDKKQKGKTYYWDGFSRDPKKRARVPNKLFFTKEVVVDLTDSYLDLSEKQTEADLRKYRAVSVHGLIDILSRYHFTVEENTPLDIDVALDPELLGKVFEKLLAAFNPETKKTARKSTGSYYTPRSIVQYMVDESIAAYLKRTVPTVSEENVRLLLSYGKDVAIDLSDKQRRAIVEAVFKCRMLDPACGSGSFPMGILQQLSHLLSRVDVDNRIWEDVVMNRALYDVQKTAHLNEEAQVKEKAEIQAVFNMSVAYPDYARKLYLIENCIYGVDIQCIAVQISRLRFFISLLCEQQPTEDAADNFGVRPLPNLEMKFVTANTLVQPANVEEAHLLFEDEEIKGLISKLRQVRHQMFVATHASNRKYYRDLDEELREKIANLSADNFADQRRQNIESNEKLLAEAETELQFAKNNLSDTEEIIKETDLFGNVISMRKESTRDRKLKEISRRVNNIKNTLKKLRETAESGRASTLALARQLTDWNPYDQNISSPFFDSDWMFGIKDGFDIVIGNPPYVRRTTLPDSDKDYYETVYFSAYGQYDLYLLFIERGIKLLSKDAFLCFINPIKFLVSDYGLKSREFILKNTTIKFIVDASQIDVFDASTYPCILAIIKRIEPDAKFYFDRFNMVNDSNSSSLFTKFRTLSSILEDKYFRIILNDNAKHNSLICHIEQKSEILSINFDYKRGLANPLVNFNGTDYFGIKSTNVEHYGLSGELANVSVSDVKAKLFTPEMVILPRTVKEIKAAIKPPQYIVLDRIYYLIPISGKFDNAYIVGILNSKLLNFWFEYYFASEKVRGGYFDLKGPQIKEIPIAVQNPEIQLQITNLVRNIISTNKFDNVPLIDKLVYQIYGLSYDEVLVVDPQPPFSREEYENQNQL